MALFDWKLLGARFVRQHKLFESMRWQLELDLSSCIVAGAPFGGPIAITRDTTKLMELRGAADEDILVFSPSGQQVRARRFAARPSCLPPRTTQLFIQCSS